jgi:hypothetical protein
LQNVRSENSKLLEKPFDVVLDYLVLVCRVVAAGLTEKNISLILHFAADDVFIFLFVFFCLLFCNT